MIGQMNGQWSGEDIFVLTCAILQGEVGSTPLGSEPGTVASESVLQA